VPEADIQIVSNEAGEPTAVIVPIALWKEIASERMTWHGGLNMIDLKRYESFVSCETRTAIRFRASIRSIGSFTK
jgi:hypothetical protein